MDINANRIIANWLLACCGLVFAMVVVGAVTRLMDAGLSMVEWRPLMGTLPPMSEAEWARVFELYQQSPEYQKKHFWMEIDDFKMIFFWEWLHRALGRVIGLAYALPLLWFWLRGMIPAGYKLKLLGLLILGGLQGLMGWYMVKSGLVDIPDVSHYRLAAHLSLAFLIFALLLWTGFSLRPIKSQPQAALYRHGWVTLGTFALTMIWGAYTAGLDAGMIYNETFPKMGKDWIPMEIMQYDPFWISFFESHTGVQFAHRWLAILTFLTVLSFWAHSKLRSHTLPVLNLLAAMIFVQAGLGIATLFSQVALPFAVMHQAGALAVLMLIVMCLKQLRPVP